MVMKIPCPYENRIFLSLNSFPVFGSSKLPGISKISRVLRRTQSNYLRQGGIKFATVCLSICPIILPSVLPSVLPFICQQDYANTTRPIILKKFNSKEIYVTQIPFGFQLHSLHSLDTKKSLKIQIGPLTFYWEVLKFPNWWRYALSEFLLILFSSGPTLYEILPGIYTVVNAHLYHLISTTRYKRWILKMPQCNFFTRHKAFINY